MERDGEMAEANEEELVAQMDFLCETMVRFVLEEVEYFQNPTYQQPMAGINAYTQVPWPPAASVPPLAAVGALPLVRARPPASAFLPHAQPFLSHFRAPPAGGRPFLPHVPAADVIPLGRARPPSVASFPPHLRAPPAAAQPFLSHVRAPPAGGRPFLPHVPAQPAATGPPLYGPHCIWVGNLEAWMDEAYLSTYFSQQEFLQVVGVKVYHNGDRETGYGFVEFISRAEAQRALIACRGKCMPDSNRQFKLNWSTVRSSPRDVQELSLFVGNLDFCATDRDLYNTFASRYPSVTAAEVKHDYNTGLSKCIGYVRFRNPEEHARAVHEMNGVPCLSRPMRVSIAAPKPEAGDQGASTSQQH